MNAAAMMVGVAPSQAVGAVCASTSSRSTTASKSALMFNNGGLHVTKLVHSSRARTMQPLRVRAEDEVQFFLTYVLTMTAFFYCFFFFLFYRSREKNLCKTMQTPSTRATADDCLSCWSRKFKTIHKIRTFSLFRNFARKNRVVLLNGVFCTSICGWWWWLGTVFEPMLKRKNSPEESLLCSQICLTKSSCRSLPLLATTQELIDWNF